MLVVNDIAVQMPNNLMPIESLTGRYQISKMEMNVFSRIYGLSTLPISHDPFSEREYCQVIDRLLENNEVEKDKVGIVIFTHTIFSAAPFGESIISKIIDHAEMKSCFYFGMSSNNCVSPSFAFDLIAKYLKTKPGKLGLLITSDIAYSKSSQIIEGTTLLGDMFTVSLISNSGPGFELKSNCRKVYGQHASGAFDKGETAKEFKEEYDRRLAGIINESLRLSKIDIEDIHSVIPHNVNILSWKRVANLLEISSKKIFFENIPKYGHCFGSDMFVNLHSLLTTKSIASGDKFVFGSAGLGSVFNGMTFEFIC